MIIYILNLLLAIAGIYVSFRIFQEKSKKELMVCPLDGDCSSVMESKYSKFLGIGLEYLGILYYGFIFSGYIFLILNKTPEIITVFLFLLTFIGFIFSLYLTLIQKYVLKMWCTWCLFSAGITTSMFIISYFAFFANKNLTIVFNDFAFYINDFINFGILILLIKSVFTVIGFCSALMTDFLTFKFLKDFKIDAKEDRTLFTLANINWTAIFTLTLTFIISYIIKIDFISPEMFKTGVIILSIILVNEIVFRFFIIPKLINYRLTSKSMDIMRVVYLRKLAFVLNVVSVISWIYILLIISFGISNKPIITEAVLGDYVLLNLIFISILLFFINWKEKIGLLKEKIR